MRNFKASRRQSCGPIGLPNAGGLHGVLRRFEAEKLGSSSYTVWKRAEIRHLCVIHGFVYDAKSSMRKAMSMRAAGASTVRPR